MKIRKNTSTMKQIAYARALWGAQGKSKKEIALNCGYSPAVAASVASHIEYQPGFKTAMSALAVESNNLAVSILYEFKKRGFDDFTNKDLVGALNAIGNAWQKFNPEAKKKETDQPANRLRTVILQQVENQQINTTQPATPVEQSAPLTDVLVDEPISVVNTEEQFDF